MQALRRFHVAILIPTLLVLAALGLAWVLTSSAAQGVTSSRTAATISSFNCGDTIIEDVLLNQNVVCPPGFDPAFGAVVTVGAANITIDGAGFTFDYSAAVNVGQGIRVLSTHPGVTIQGLTFTGAANNPVYAQGNNFSLLNNTIPNGRVYLDGIGNATADGNTLTANGAFPVSALQIENVPGNSTYNISNNVLTNPIGIGLNIGKVDNPGMALTLENNTFDGSRWGAILNNIQGPFTLSQTNSFDGAGHSGGYPVSSSGVDVTVDGWTATTTANTLGVAGGGTGINVAIRSLRFSASNSEDIKITNNTINNPTQGVVMNSVVSATITGNQLTGTGAFPVSALSIANVPPNSTYNITNNSLTNPTAIGLNIGTVDNPGMALTLEGNTFDGSRWGAILNNIQGPFTLSQTNSFDGAGHSGGYPVSISGVDVTVDGWTATTTANTLGVAGGGTGINVAIRSLRFSASNSQDIKITNNTINNPTQGVVMNSVVSATITGNTLTGTGGHPVSALSIANVPPNSTYNITNNSLTNPNAIGLNIGTVDNPGMALTLENNTFDGSRWGAVLNNIQGPFTLSQTNSFAGAGHSGGYPVSISGVDVTVDGWTTLGVAGGGTGINVAIRSLRFSASNSEDIKITNNTINNPTQGVVMNSVVSATITGNTLTGTGGHPVSALSIANVPPNSTYNITNNSLTNPNAIGLNIGTVDNPGIALTLENNTFDGSRWGAILNNIQGPFTLSQTNSFAGAGHSGGYPVSISGVDVTVDGWTTLGVAGGGTGINVAIRSHRFSSSNSRDINITNNTINNPTQGVVMNNVLSATITGNQLTGTGGHPVSALSIANVPGNSTYNITNNSLTNPTTIGLNIGTVDNPGMALTADGNTFDGSRFGAILNNIQGPFTLSTTNSFDGAGHSGGISLTISGVDLTVDGFAFSFATVEGGAGIAVGNRVHRFSASPSSGITISNTTVTGFGSGISASLLNNDLTLENVTACSNNQGIGIRSNGADVLGGNVEGNSVEGIRVFSGSTNVLIDGVNFFNNPAGKDVVDDTGAATVQNSTNNPFDCPPAVTLTSIAVTPDPASVAVGSTIQFTATGTFSDDSTGDITDGTWSSSNPSVATIDAATGVATGVIMGTTNITAMKGTITSLTVTLNVFYTCMGLTATIVGTNGPDYIVGTTGDDVIASLGGDDVVLGMWGNDIICLGDGDDFGAGGDGKDKIAGEAGDDDLWGGARRDRLWGGTGNDLLRGGRGGDRLVGGSGDDVAFGGPGKDRHNCGAGYDFANGGPGTDTATASCEATWSIP